MTITDPVPRGALRPRCALAALLTLALAFAGGCAGSRRDAVQAAERPLKPAATPTAEVESAGVEHVVEAGQTLWRIAKVYGLDVHDLARANGIVDPAALEIGQRLVVPGATSVLRVPPYPAPLGGEPRPRAAGVEPSRFAWPVQGGGILSYYGAPRRTHSHAGIDIRGRYGQPVHAAESGRVVYSGSTLRGYGKTVIIDHGDDLRSLYAHNSELLVREGDRVARGQAIARVGRTGNASTEHCHFEIRRNDVAVDPLPYLESVTENTR